MFPVLELAELGMNLGKATVPRYVAIPAIIHDMMYWDILEIGERALFFSSFLDF